MNKYLNLILCICLFGCSESDSEHYFQLFEKEAGYQEYKEKQYYIEKRREYSVDYLLGIVPIQTLIFKTYCIKDSLDREIIELHLWREGALKPHHGDELTYSKYSYNKHSEQGITIEEKYEEVWYHIWDKPEIKKWITTKNNEGFITNIKLIWEGRKFEKNYQPFNNIKINYILSNEFFYDLIDIKFDNQVVLMEKDDIEQIHIFNNTPTDSLKNLINKYATLYYYDDKLKIISEKHFHREKLNTEYIYEYINDDEIKTINVSVNNKLRRIEVIEQTKL